MPRTSHTGTCDELVHGVRTRDLSCRLAGADVLDGITLSIERGRIHALLGRNGAGKTTLVRVLAGIVSPSGGYARVDGHDAAQPTPALRRSIGLVPSGDRTFYLRLSGLENLVFFARLHGFRRREAVSRARRSLAAVGLADAERKRVGLYSHGMQKRLSIARAMLAEPHVLLLDEATHDLDPEAAAGVRDLVRVAAARGAAILWCTQRVEEIVGFADEVTVLESGRALFTGPVEELVGRVPTAAYVVTLRNGHPGPPDPRVIKAALRGLAGVTSAACGGAWRLSVGRGGLGSAIAAFEAAGITVEDCRPAQPRVEEAFASLLAGLTQ